MGLKYPIKITGIEKSPLYYSTENPKKIADRIGNFLERLDVVTLDEGKGIIYVYNSQKGYVLIEYDSLDSDSALENLRTLENKLKSYKHSTASQT